MLIAESEAQVETLNDEIATVQAQLDEVQNEQLENTRAIMRVQKNAERYLTKRQTLIGRKEECNNAIRDLGVLPDEAYTKYVQDRPDKVSLYCTATNPSLSTIYSSSRSCIKSMKDSRSSPMSTRKPSSNTTISRNSVMICLNVVKN